MARTLDWCLRNNDTFVPLELAWGDAGGRGRTGGQPFPAADDSIATRASLLDRLKDREDQASWQEFFDIYWQLISPVMEDKRLIEDCLPIAEIWRQRLRG